MDYLCAADYLQLPKFSLENWYIFRENNPIFTKIVLCMVPWIEKVTPKNLISPTLPKTDGTGLAFRFHFFVFCVWQCSQNKAE